MSTRWINDLIGTFKSYLRIGETGPRLKNNSGALNVRNAADSADAAITAAAGTFSGNVGVTGTVVASSSVTGTTLNLTGTLLTVNSDAAGSGTDWKMIFQLHAAMTQHVTYTWPADDGSPSQVLATDGSGNLTWVSAASTTDCVHVDTTSLAFGSASTVSMFTLPANAVVHKVEVIIDTAFDGAPSVSVGVSGTASKYVASTDVDLTLPAATVFEVNPALAANGSTEALQIAYSAGGATAGAARVLVHYSVPA